MSNTGSKRQSLTQLLKGCNPEIAKLLRVAHEQGFGISLSGGMHYKVLSPDGIRPRRMAFCPKTPSEYRAMANTKRKLKHIGVKFP